MYNVYYYVLYCAPTKCKKIYSTIDILRILDTAPDRSQLLQKKWLFILRALKLRATMVKGDGRSDRRIHSVTDVVTCGTCLVLRLSLGQ